MNRPIFQLLLLIGALTTFGCGDDSADDGSVQRDSGFSKPELSIGELDLENRSMEVTISNPSTVPIFVPGSGVDSVYGAYWFDGDELVDLPECGTGFWDNSISIPPKGVERLKVLLPHFESELPAEVTLAIVYGGHGEVTRDELPSMSDNDPRINLIRHPDALIGCRKMEAIVTLARLTEAEQGADVQLPALQESKAQ